MGGVLANCLKTGCCCDAEGVWEANATTYGLEELKSRLEGQQHKAKTNPITEPEIYFTILEINKKDSGAIRFTPKKFELKDLIFKVEVEIHGTKGELAQKAATKGVEVAMQKVGVDSGKRSSITGKIAKASAKISSASDKVKEKIGVSSTDVRTLIVDVTLDLTKEWNHEEVGVKIKDLGIDRALLQKILSIDVLRKHVERAISVKASEVATKLGREKAGEFKKHMPAAASALGY